jgi:hypothetical protein
VKAHQDDKKPYEDLDIWGHMNCDVNGLAEKFQKLLDDGDVKLLKEGFFTDSMEVGISVDENKVTSQLLHQIHWRYRDQSFNSIYRINMPGLMLYGTVLIGQELSPDSCCLVL